MNSIGTETGHAPPTGQVEIDELKHLIHKLRWMGMEREAENVSARLSRIAPAASTRLSKARKPD